MADAWESDMDADVTVAWIEHEAGRLEPDGTQPCLRCGKLLSDYRHAMVVAGTMPFSGWSPGPVFQDARSGTTTMAARPDPDPITPCTPPPDPFFQFPRVAPA